MGSARSPFRDFESYRRIVVGLVESDIQLILKDYNSNFVTYKLSPGIYTIKDISEAVYTMGDQEGTLQIENNDISMKTKFVSTRLGSTFGTLRFDEKCFFLKHFWVLHHIGITNQPMQFMLIGQMFVLVNKF